MFFNPPINLEPPVFRPPSEGRSLLIQLTIGCSNNKCTYCDMYALKKYRVRSINDILLDIKKAHDFYQSKGKTPDKIFLCDGDALGAPMDVLIPTLDALNSVMPEIRSIGAYATAENILNKSEEELRLLSSKKLNIAYLGLESGDDQVLHMIAKGNTASEMLEASLKIKECGFKLSTIVMLGVGGRTFSKEHVLNTAKVIGETAPHFFSFLTTVAIPGTPYFKMVERGLIEPLTVKELLQEMHDILKLAEFKSNSVIFRANHVSNMFPLAGVLPKDTAEILKTIKHWINETPEGIYPKIPLQM
jgi:radical SAM superfamily enzyme YgiQ (UPF0313 family)